MSLRITQLALVVAAAGALLLLSGLLPRVADLVAVGAIILGTVLCAPAGRGPAGGWWTILSIGAVLSLAGALLSLASASVGGLLALIGGVAAITGAIIGFPLDGRRRERF